MYNVNENIVIALLGLRCRAELSEYVCSLKVFTQFQNEMVRIDFMSSKMVRAHRFQGSWLESTTHTVVNEYALIIQQGWT